MNGVFAAALPGVLLALPLKAADDSDYFNLQKGGEWVSDAETVHKDGTVTKAVEHEKVEGKVEKDGKVYYKIRDWMEPDPDSLSNERLWRKTETGCYVIWEGEKEHLEIQFPIAVGMKWGWSGSGFNWIGRVVGLETVTVGEHTYKDCYHLRSESVDGAVSQDYWEAPNVGTVKTETVMNGMHVRTVLREFHPAERAKRE